MKQAAAKTTSGRYVIFTCVCIGCSDNLWLKIRAPQLTVQHYSPTVMTLLMALKSVSLVCSNLHLDNGNIGGSKLFLFGA